MPVKRPHKKSRYGCNRCRERRVKCDEALPRCSTCMKRNETCEYTRQPLSCTDSNKHDSPPESASGSTHSADPELINPSIAAPNSTSRWASVRLNELYLMHHWCTRTCHSFTSKYEELSREFVPREAFRHGYLMDALLAVTALHIATETADASIATRHVGAALRYQNHSVAELHKTLENISPDNVNAVVLTSIFLMIGSVLSPLLPAASDEAEIKSTADIMIPLVHFTRGIGAIVIKNRHWLLQGPLMDWFRGSEHVIITPNKSFPHLGYQILNRAVSASINESQPTYYLNHKAMERLEDAYHQGKSMLRWLSTSEPEFLQELQRGATVALAIFMFWGVLLDQADDMWWARYAGKRLVEDMATTLDESEERWKSLTHWCRERVGLPAHEQPSPT
ncbi:hypothetical protein BS50DRAFT_372584 [Corynespora cassiicola Philippines]|uniref:Zn(2)-C6 fungal-type domain-containing protein n=1 Tax=Corynespora cassiicola Philippines TaxID=1448308 RepID=A0A2T2NN79_CORCC|nr:hypothetical protein BS50DRAFT_372584 [Corynespora cassiicola Philippines]